jgi:serine phosphatase RsbU (regulator of sigma subunit)
MGRMRSALRAYALESTDPTEVLARLDKKMQHFEPGALATVSYAVFSPAIDSMQICLAGHYPPVIASPGQPASLADVPPNLLIGAAADTRRAGATVHISPGTLVGFYTDGLVERRHQPLDERLKQLCAAVHAKAPEAVCADVMAELVGAEPSRDDIALLTLLSQPADEVSSSS